MMSFRKSFPFFDTSDVIYLDSAATTQKPQQVLDAMQEYYTKYCSNTHRSSHGLGNKATQKFEQAREKIADFIGANPEQIIFTKGTTESINLLASNYVKKHFKTVIISELEHHANIVPWQLQGFSQGAGLLVVPVTEDLLFDLSAFEKMIKENPKSFVSLLHVSNVSGTVFPVKEIITIAHEYECEVLIDGAQAVAHMSVDVKELDVDFYAFSAHKMYGPTGVGVLYGKKQLLEKMDPYQGGGAMIEKVSFEKTLFLAPPQRFEAGTQPIAQVIGFGSAVDYLLSIGFESITKHDQKLTSYTKEKLMCIEGMQLFASPDMTVGSLSFRIEGFNINDLSILLDKQNVFIRTGHHCAMPIMEKLGIDGTLRVSFGIYNKTQDIDTL